MTLTIKSVPLDDILTDDKIRYNTNNHWVDDIRPENYDEIMASGHTNKWADQFRAYKK